MIQELMKQSSSPLFHFALRANLPIAEKFVFAYIASQWGEWKDSDMWADAHQLERALHIPYPATDKILRSLLRNRLIEEVSTATPDHVVYRVNSLIPLLYEHKILSHCLEASGELFLKRTRAEIFDLSCAIEDEVIKQRIQVDRISDKSIELHRMLIEWRDVERRLIGEKTQLSNAEIASNDNQ